MPSRVGEKIRQLRKERKVSLERLAKLTDTSKSYLWELESRDVINPSAEKLVSIAEVLKVRPEFLMDDRLTKLEPSEADEAFFRKYRGLDRRTKRKLEQFLAMLEEDEEEEEEDDEESAALADDDEQLELENG